MKFHSRIFSFVFSFVSLFSFSQSNQQQFYLKGMVGIQGSQIDGDYYAGYNKAGFIAGLNLFHDFNEKKKISFSLLYSQKGARKNPNPEKGSYDYYRASVDYVEIPLQLYHQFKSFSFFGGCYYGQLIKAKESNQNGDIVTGVKFKSGDFGYVLGGEKAINSRAAIGVRFSYSLIPIRDYFFNGQIYYYNIIQRVFNRGLYNNTLSFYLNYTIMNSVKKSNE